MQDEAIYGEIIKYNKLAIICSLTPRLQLHAGTVASLYRTVFALYLYGAASSERISKGPASSALNHFGLHANLQHASRAVF